MNRGQRTALSDNLLMANLAKGETQALGELYDRYDKMVKVAIVRFAPEIPASSVEELCQDTFLTLNKTAARYQERSQLKAWLYGIAVNKARAWRARTWLRRRLLKEHSGKGIAMALPNDSSLEKRSELRNAIRNALTELPKPQRDVLMLHAFEGFKSAEIASILKMNPEAVRTRLHRARRALLKVIDPEIVQAFELSLGKGEA